MSKYFSFCKKEKVTILVDSVVIFACLLTLNVKWTVESGYVQFIHKSLSHAHMRIILKKINNLGK